jgi:hypothetical protein
VPFDTKTSALAVVPNGLRTGQAPVRRRGSREHAVRDGQRLDDDQYCFIGGFHWLRLQEEGDNEDEKPRKSSSKEDSPARWLWSDYCRPLPLSPDGVRAHALHPRGICCHYVRGDCGVGTFSYNTEKGRWARHGGWELPFVGQGHYHNRPARMAAWVGLHGGSMFRPDGHLCSCDVPHLGRGRGRARAAPGWKLGREKLFLEDPERHVDAKLVDMGGGRFFLVDILTREGVSWEESVGDGDRCVLRLATGSSPPRLAGLLARTSSPAIGAASIGKRSGRNRVTCMPSKITWGSSDGSSLFSADRPERAAFVYSLAHCPYSAAEALRENNTSIYIRSH